MNESANIKLLLFDLGGVLMELNDPIKTFGLDCDEQEFHRRWLLSPAVRAHECGAISAEQFANDVTREMQLPYDPYTFLDRFGAWPGSPYPEAIDLIGRIDARLDCAILSNTNAFHWDNLDIKNAFAHRFDRCFLSYETGLLKPDAHAYTHVADEYKCDLAQIHFFDDNPLNVAAAAELGMQATLCRSGADIAESLNNQGFLDGQDRSG
jgi:HAD superfamily hydrolase (TIGR01509 family)